MTNNSKVVTKILGYQIIEKKNLNDHENDQIYFDIVDKENFIIGKNYRSPEEAIQFILDIKDTILSQHNN